MVPRGEEAGDRSAQAAGIIEQKVPVVPQLSQPLGTEDQRRPTDRPGSLHVSDQHSSYDDP